MNTTDYILASIYLVLWVCTFAIYQWNRNRIDGGTLVIGMQVVYAIASILSFSSILEPQHTYHHLSLFPYLYLWVMMSIAITPIWYVHSRDLHPIESPQTLILRLLSWFIIIMGIARLPEVISSLGNGFAAIMSDAEAGKDAYNESLKAAQDSGNGIENIVAIIINAFSDIAIFLLFYYMTLVKGSMWIQMGLLLVVGEILIIPILGGQRGNTIIAMLTVAVAFMMWRPYMNTKIRWWTNRIAIIGAIAFTLPVAAITISRFDNEKIGVGGSLYWYIGQGSVYFNNYALDNNGIRYGDRTFNLIKRIIDPSTPANFEERRAKYGHLFSDDNIFSTFVGDFCLDFGPWLTVLIFLLFNGWAIGELYQHKNTWQIRHMLLLYLVLCINIQGGMTLFSYSDTAGLRLFLILFLYFYLKIHDRLVAKFGR